MSNKGFTTIAVHSERWGKPEHGSLRKPIHTSIAYGYEKSADLAAVFQNRAKGYAYARQANPTVTALEEKVTALEGGVGTVCFSTGMAAFAAAALALLRDGDHIVSSSYLFGNTSSQLSTLARIGIEVTFVDATDVKNVANAITPRTRIVLVETIANPVTQVADLAAIGKLCKERGLIYIIDNTLTSPYLFKPITVDATFSWSSLSKYFGGHGAALGGSLTDLGHFDWSTYANIYDLYKGGEAKNWALVQIRKKGLRDFGATLSPEASHTLSLGSETLALRMDRHCDNAERLALFLSEQKQVAKVHYPGLSSHPQYNLVQNLFRRPGALLSFELASGLDTLAFLDQLELVICSSNLGDTRTLAIPVAQTIFFELGPEKRAEMGIADGLIRLSVGIEDASDLIADFTQAFAAFK